MISPEEAFQSYRSHCLAKEGAVEDHPWGDVAWKVGGKMFACGGEQSCSVTVRTTPEKQAALVQHPNIEVAAYVGRYGWVTVHARDQETLDIALDLIDESYEAVRRGKGPKRRRADGGRSQPDGNDGASAG